MLVFSLFGLLTHVCVAQTDTARATRPSPSPTTTVPIPGVDTPLSGPGTLLQSSPNPNAQPVSQPKGRKRRLRTSPPSDPRAFGVAIPLEGAKKDTLRQ